MQVKKNQASPTLSPAARPSILHAYHFVLVTYSISYIPYAGKKTPTLSPAARASLLYNYQFVLVTYRRESLYR